MDPILHLFQRRPKENWAWTLNASRVTWTRDNALALANCALLAYSDPKTVRSQLLDRGFDEVKWCDPLGASAAAEAYVAIRNDAIIVAFRGTEPTSLADWAAGFRTAQVPVDDVPHRSGWGRVHGGFATSLGTVLPRVVEAISRHDGAAHSLWITGHSLGGALALLAGAVLAKQERHPIAGVITFGQPRVGDPQFAARYSLALGDRTFRCVNDQDIVPHVPPRTLSGIERLLVSVAPPGLAGLAGAGETYAHCGQLRLLLPEGGVTENAVEEQAREPAPLAQARSPLSVALDWPALLGQFPGRLKDHALIVTKFLTGYVDRLERLASD